VKINWSGSKHPRGSLTPLGRTSSGGRHRATSLIGKTCMFCRNVAKYETENARGRKIPICGACKTMLS
jgi:hypothetical protein